MIVTLLTAAAAPGITLKTSPSAPVAPSRGVSIAILLASILGPILTFALLWVSWKRYQNVPAAQEEKLQRAFTAWLPVGIIDAIYVVIAIGAVAISEPP